MLTDPIADMLTRLRNASNVEHDTVVLPYSKEKKAVLDIFAENNFIESVEVVDRDGGKYQEIEVQLNTKKKINPKRVSSPGRRVYVKKNEIKPIKSGLGLMVISTSKGIMSADSAKEKELGGEVICEIC